MIGGALGDIGGAIAGGLAGRGADVALSDLHPPEGASEALVSLRKLGVQARYDQVDVADPKQVEDWVELAASEWERSPSLIITNAAIVTPSPIAEITPEQWQREITVNRHVTGTAIVMDGGLSLVGPATGRKEPR